MLTASKSEFQAGLPVMHAHPSRRSVHRNYSAPTPPDTIFRALEDVVKEVEKLRAEVYRRNLPLHVNRGPCLAKRHWFMHRAAGAAASQRDGACKLARIGCSNVKLEAACSSASQADIMQKRLTSTEGVIHGLRCLTLASVAHHCVFSRCTTFVLRGDFDGFKSDMSREAIQGMISTKFDGLAAMILKEMKAQTSAQQAMHERSQRQVFSRRFYRVAPCSLISRSLRVACAGSRDTA